MEKKDQFKLLDKSKRVMKVCHVMLLESETEFTFFWVLTKYDQTFSSDPGHTSLPLGQREHGCACDWEVCCLLSDLNLVGLRVCVLCANAFPYMCHT